VVSVALAVERRAPIDTDLEGGRIESLLTEPLVTPIFVGELGPRAREETILDRAGGNPFYINEILESLAESGTLRAVPEPDRPGPPRFALVQRGAEVV